MMAFMAKSGKRKKQDRRQRQHRAADEARRRERQARQAAAIERARVLLESLRSPETPVSEVAGAILELWDPDPPTMPVLGSVVEGDPDRLAAVAAAVSQASPGSFWAQVMEIELAGLVNGDSGAASKLIDEALEQLTGPGELKRRLVLGHRMLALGEPLRAFRIAQAELAALTEPVPWAHGVGVEGGAAEETAGADGWDGEGTEHGAAEGTAGANGRDGVGVEGGATEGTAEANGWDGEDGEPRVDLEMAIDAVVELQQMAVEEDPAATVEAFTDRAALTRLETALSAWLEDGAKASLEQWEDDLTGQLPPDARDVVPVEAVRGIVRCAGLIQPRAADGADDDFDEDDLDEDDLDEDDFDEDYFDNDGQDGTPRVSLINRFASDPATSAELAGLAQRWWLSIHFGLWRVDDSVGEHIGVELVDLVSKVRRYVPLASLGDRPPARWSVLLGALTCVDGVWRPATPMMPLSPVEGDALAELASDASEAVLGALAGKKRPAARQQRALFGTAPPHGVLADTAEPSPMFLSRILHTIVTMLVTDMVLEVAAYRSAGPALRNTDGDPLVMVRAAVAIDDPDTMVARLMAHQDITVDPDNGELCWWGRALTPAEVANSRAQFAAQTGVEPEVDPDYVQRWLRGRVRADGTLLRLEVNSTQRLDRFCGLLRQLGADPTVVERITVDPEQDMVLPRGPLLPAPRPPEVDAAWAKHWLDEKVPALKGRTPRQAARSEQHEPLLEALLRKFEWDEQMRPDSDHGPRPSTTRWIREQLGLVRGSEP
jgi:hypothetical protein